MSGADVTRGVLGYEYDAPRDESFSAFTMVDLQDDMQHICGKEAFSAALPLLLVLVRFAPLLA
jgi:hypothetical protein